jgi:type VI secretion system secreted protein Hcp
VTKVSKASPKLFLACTTGQHIKEAALVGGVVKEGKDRQEFFNVKLTDILTSSYQQGGSSGDIPTDQFSLGKLCQDRVRVRSQRADGSLDAPVKVGYDLKANKKVWQTIFLFLFY